MSFESCVSMRNGLYFQLRVFLGLLPTYGKLRSQKWNSLLFLLQTGTTPLKTLWDSYVTNYNLFTRKKSLSHQKSETLTFVLWALRFIEIILPSWECLTGNYSSSSDTQKKSLTACGHISLSLPWIWSLPIMHFFGWLDWGPSIYIFSLISACKFNSSFMLLKDANWHI